LFYGIAKILGYTYPKKVETMCASYNKLIFEEEQFELFIIIHKRDMEIKKIVTSINDNGKKYPIHEIGYLRKLLFHVLASVES